MVLYKLKRGIHHVLKLFQAYRAPYVQTPESRGGSRRAYDEPNRGPTFATTPGTPVAGPDFSRAPNLISDSIALSLLHDRWYTVFTVMASINLNKLGDSVLVREYLVPYFYALVLCINF